MTGDSSNDDTLPDDGGETTQRAPRLSLASYELGEAIGEGGMGEVLLARDRNIGRNVAIKRMRGAGAAPELVERFLREAKIQARLDHPAIVPVYELGRDRDGQPYFTMKRLSGTTLLAKLAHGGDSPQALLRAFVEVCRAIDFAHARGVVHRDLKPANIMLGDFGEVYVLDWGIARIIEIEDALTPAAGSPSVASEAHHTQAGALLGTPGYMAPEQASGERIGPAADVYALGAILFELLAGEPVHARGPSAVANTIAHPQHSPAQRRPDRAIAPELDAACTDALAGDPTARPSARSLAERVQSYLDGDRDLERRRALAAEHLARARALAADPERRADAIRDAGRALALDPESDAAAALVMTFMIEPPKQLPAPLVRQLAASDMAASVRSARQASYALASTVLFIPLLAYSGVSNTPLIVAIYAIIAMLFTVAHTDARRGRTNDLVPFFVGIVVIVLLGQLLSPFIFIPIVICGLLVGLGGQPQLLGHPRLVIAGGLSAFVLPCVLERAGVLPRTWELVDDKLIITPGLVHLAGVSGYMLLIVGHVFLLTVISIFLRAQIGSRRDARRAIEIQAWQLRQLLPARSPVTR